MKASALVGQRQCRTELDVPRRRRRRGEAVRHGVECSQRPWTWSADLSRKEAEEAKQLHS